MAIEIFDGETVDFFGKLFAVLFNEFVGDPGDDEALNRAKEDAETVE